MLQKFITLWLFLFSFSCNIKSENSKKSIAHKNFSVASLNDTLITPPKVSAKKINILAVGDMMLGTNYPSTSSLPSNYPSLLFGADSLIKGAAIAFGNCEGTFMNNGGIPKGSGANIFCFRQPENYVKAFEDAGFDLLSIANNHINDFGTIGIENTIKVLSNTSIGFAGTLSHPSTFIKKEDLVIGLVAFAPHSGCVNMNDLENAIRLVKESKKKCDILLVSFHGGAEGANATHVLRKSEIFYGQNRGNVYEFAHNMIDAGADVVIGHGPHVPRAIELYQSKLIAYSLGNFCTYGMFNLKGISGYAPLLQFSINENGDFMNGKIISFKQLNEGGPVLDKTNSAAALIKKLSKEDFPDNQLIFDDDGTFSKK